jgi:hypothetical protein
MLWRLIAGASIALASVNAVAEETVKIGLILPMTGAGESPRGPMTIDPETRDVISNIYMRRVERVNGELWNIEFATVENVKDPVKAGKK